MASNKRILKKEIKMICGALAGECVVAQMTIPGIDNNAFTKIIFELADLQENAIDKISISMPQTPKSFANNQEYRKARRAYFKAAFKRLKDEFNNHIEAIVKEMNVALPQEQKDANKAALKS